MKKLVNSLVILLLVITLVPSVAFAKGKETNLLSYNGITVNKNQISSETLEWLEWYNSLSEELQNMVSYEPAELRLIVKTSATPDKTEDAQSFKLITPFETSLLPTSGYEPVYNPDYWNKSENIKRANCYAYAMDVLKTTEGKLQPGELSGKIFTSLTESAIFEAAKNDGPYLGSGRSIKRANRDDKPGKNEYKVALVIAPDLDYHWYIQNRDGYWSHKRGLTEVSNLDASGKKISDPKSCDRNYGSLNYSTFCGYYIVKYTGK
ncbi:MAG: Peptidase-C39-2 domain-containing protein [Lachnoclostridium sp.]|jgi:hypothetical protein